MLNGLIRVVLVELLPQYGAIKAARLKSMEYALFSPIILNGASKCCIQRSDPLVESSLFRLSARLRPPEGLSSLRQVYIHIHTYII